MANETHDVSIVVENAFTSELWVLARDKRDAAYYLVGKLFEDLNELIDNDSMLHKKNGIYRLSLSTWVERTVADENSADQ